MKTTTDIQISNLRASLNGKVIGPDDPGTTTRAASSSPASTVGPRRSSAPPTHPTSPAS